MALRGNQPQPKIMYVSRNHKRVTDICAKFVQSLLSVCKVCAKFVRRPRSHGIKPKRVHLCSLQIQLLSALLQIQLLSLSLSAVIHYTCLAMLSRPALSFDVIIEPCDLSRTTNPLTLVFFFSLLRLQPCQFAFHDMEGGRGEGRLSRLLGSHGWLLLLRPCAQ